MSKCAQRYVQPWAPDSAPPGVVMLERCTCCFYQLARAGTYTCHGCELMHALRVPNQCASSWAGCDVTEVTR